MLFEHRLLVRLQARLFYFDDLDSGRLQPIIALLASGISVGGADQVERDTAVCAPKGEVSGDEVIRNIRGTTNIKVRLG